MDTTQCLRAIRENIKKAVVGKDDVIDLLLVALLCSGHVLLEDLPGLGKTTLVSALADSLGCRFQRIQFTPDVLPADITGFNMYHMQTGEEIFHPGSIHNQMILADEINRASPKTQSALLEAMQERQVTVDGHTYALPHPFMVMATQNPVDMAGTYPLPEAQMDRFLMQIKMGYPTPVEEVDILRRHRSVTEKITLQAVATAEDVLAMQQQVGRVHMEPVVMAYIVELVTATRNREEVLMGASPRGTIALSQAACGFALLQGRAYVVPEDVKRLAPYVLAHRLIMKSRIGSSAVSAEDVIREIIRTIPVPRAKG